MLTREDIQRVTRVLDLTLLNEEASTSSLLALCEAAKNYELASLCVYPKHLALLRSKTSCRLATVVNFPSGQEDLENNIALIHQLSNSSRPQQALTDEIDYVFPYDLYLLGEEERAFEWSQKVLSACQEHAFVTKIIIETEVYPDPGILFQIAQRLIQQGWNFLKTSTGKRPIGATLEASHTLLQALVESKTECGIKISGGIQHWDQAMAYIHQAESALNRPIASDWFRVGSSRLLEHLPPHQDQ
jgi:deoxyribose-phosphate aldolase